MKKKSGKEHAQTFNFIIWLKQQKVLPLFSDYNFTIYNQTTYFIGNFEYENDGIACNYTAKHGSVKLVKVFNTYDEGRIVYKTNQTYYAETFLKDHLGNIRANSPTPNHKNQYKYNRKMLQDDLILNWLDYGARFYDPTLGRWMARK